VSTPEVSVFGGEGWQVVDEATIRGRARVDGSVRAELVAAAGSGDLDAVLDVLVARGLRSLPDFAFVSLADDLARVVVRGAGQVVVDGEDGARTITHAGRGPWLEEDVPTTGTLRIGEPAAASPSGNADVPRSPVVEGPAAGAGGMTGWARPRRFGRRTAGDPAAAPAVAPAVQGKVSADEVEPPPLLAPPTAAGGPEVPPSLSTGMANSDEELPSYDHLFGATQFALPTEIERVEEPTADEHDTPAVEEPAVSPRPPELTMPPPDEDRGPLVPPPAPAPAPVEPPAPPPPPPPAEALPPLDDERTPCAIAADEVPQVGEPAG
jgi:hypothetical protein